MAQYDLHEDRGLTTEDLGADPIAAFERWLGEAADAGQIEPTAMSLATATADGTPSNRMVLFKGLRDGGFCFYTNFDSRKGHELADNARVALLFWWDKLQRQVRIDGTASRIPQDEANAYYQTRSRGSRIGAWASRQSQVVTDRAELEGRVAHYEAQFDGKDVPIPDFWGGYRVEPSAIEFWQGRDSRLHDRIVFSRSADGWTTHRLEP